MPLYDYQCPKCGAVREVKLTLKDLEKRRAIFCEKCPTQMKRLISAPNIIVHGFNAKNRYSHEKPKKKKDT